MDMTEEPWCHVLDDGQTQVSLLDRPLSYAAPGLMSRLLHSNPSRSRHGQRGGGGLVDGEKVDWRAVWMTFRKLGWKGSPTSPEPESSHSLVLLYA